VVPVPIPAHDNTFQLHAQPIALPIVDHIPIGRQQQPRRPKQQQFAKSPVAPSPQVHGNQPDAAGNYDFSFDEENGAHREEQGTQEFNGEEDVNVIRGSYSYISPEGESITVNYIADENGFQPQGSHIPTGPALHPSIQRSLDFIASVNARHNNRA
jgi:hypothetical protein